MSQADKPRVVIVGGGFGGLEAARALAKADCQITLIDQRKLTRFDWRSAVGGPPAPGAASAGNPPLGGPVTADPQLQQKSVRDLAKQANVEAPPVATSAPAQSPSPTDTTSSATTTPATTTPAATSPARTPP